MVEPSGARPDRPLRAASRQGPTDTLDRDPGDEPRVVADPSPGAAPGPGGSEADAPTSGPPATADPRGPSLDAARRASAPAPDPTGRSWTTGLGRPAPLARLRSTTTGAPARQLAEGLALCLVGVGLLLGWVVHVSWTPLLDVGLVVIGAVLVLQSRRSGPSRPLIALGVLLALVAAGTWRAGTTLDGGLGRRTERPLASGPQVGTYRLGTGQLTIDARRTAYTSEPLRIDAEVGVGRIVVRVPEDAVVTTRAVAGGGHSLVFSERKVGPGIDERYDNPPLGTRAVVLDLRVGLGSVEVTRG